MSSASSAAPIGIDFWTSNTVVAIAADDRRVEAIRIDHGGQRHSVFVSALCFWEDRPGAGAQAEGGPWAIEQFLEGRHVFRILQSFKTFAARSRCLRPRRLLRGVALGSSFVWGRSFLFFVSFPARGGFFFFFPPGPT